MGTDLFNTERNVVQVRHWRRSGLCGVLIGAEQMVGSSASLPRYESSLSIDGKDSQFGPQRGSVRSCLDGNFCGPCDPKPSKMPRWHGLTYSQQSAHAALMSKPSTDSAIAGPPSATCGVVMPISAIDGCDEQHWSDVKTVLFDAIRSSNYHPELVSSADDVGVIQARIVKNLYENPIVICDVSGRNANVMFELGMRLAFDKPTVIVIDDKTPFSFDTAPIEHLKYPRDLRYGRIKKFKEDLASKIMAVAKSAQGAEYSTFLKHFGSFTAAKLEKKELAPSDFVTFVTQKLTELDEKVTRIDRGNRSMLNNTANHKALTYSYGYEFPQEHTEKLRAQIEELDRALLNNPWKDEPERLKGMRRLREMLAEELRAVMNKNTVKKMDRHAG